MKYEIQLIIEPPKGNAENAVKNWVQNHNEWTGDGQEHSLTEHDDTEPDYDGDPYIHGIYRFNQDSAADVSEVVDDLESRLSRMQGGLWYKIGATGECTHDREDGRRIEDYKIIRHGGSPPDSVPEAYR